METNKMFEISRRNAEWLKENYENLKKEYDNHWVMIRDRRVIETASTFDEIMRAIRNHNPNEILVEYIQSKQIAMFF